MIRIGARVGPDWLDRPDDLRFLQQIGVGCLDITLDMADVAGALHAVDYDGVIDYDHAMQLINDSVGKSYIAYCVGHMRGILTSVQGNLERETSKVSPRIF